MKELQTFFLFNYHKSGTTTSVSLRGRDIESLQAPTHTKRREHTFRRPPGFETAISHQVAQEQKWSRPRGQL